MKPRFYGTYGGRSLARGGQRTLLAVFCIAVGVMAIVGLQLVSAMVREAITGNARAVNQGDVSIGLSAAPLQTSDLSFFDGLRASGAISSYTAQASAAGIMQLPDGKRHTVSVRAVDPTTFPLVGSHTLVLPAGETLTQALAQNGSAIVSRRLFGEIHTPLGATLKVLTTSGSVAQVRLAGVAPIEKSGVGPLGGAGWVDP